MKRGTANKRLAQGAYARTIPGKVGPKITVELVRAAMNSATELLCNVKQITS